MGDTFIREFEVKKDVVLNIHQKLVGEEGCVVWDAALVLAKYLIHDANNDSHLQLANSSVIELGAGTAIVGLTAAVLGADVAVTDVEEYVPLMQKNIDCNKKHLKGKVKACSLKWGSVSQFNEFVPKYILVSDCLYYQESLEPLVATLSALSNNETIILFCYEKRYSQQKLSLENAFIKLVEDKFIIKEVSGKQLHPEFQCSDIKLLQFIKK